LAKDGFFSEDGPIAGENLRRFFIRGGLLGEPALVAFLKTQALAKYQEFGIVKSGLMARAIVHSNGDKTFVSGGYEDAFIVGRHDLLGLGVSSVFLPDSLPQRLDLVKKTSAGRSKVNAHADDEYPENAHGCA